MAPACPGMKILQRKPFLPLPNTGINSVDPGGDEDSTPVVENLTLLMVPFPPPGATVSGRPNQPGTTTAYRTPGENDAVPGRSDTRNRTIRNDAENKQNKQGSVGNGKHCLPRGRSRRLPQGAEITGIARVTSYVTKRLTNLQSIRDLPQGKEER